MNEFIIITGLSGAYLIMMSVTIDAGNFKSKLVFKVVPSILGFSCLFAALKMGNFF